MLNLPSCQILFLVSQFIMKSWLLFIMSTLVVFHVALRCELFTTNAAFKRFLFGVDSHVYDQVRSLREGFLAPVERASEWLGSKMQMQVCLQSALPREALPTPRVCTIKASFGIGILLEVFC